MFSLKDVPYSQQMESGNFNNKDFKSVSDNNMKSRDSQ